jgi:phosphatidylglycerophosphatase A
VLFLNRFILLFATGFGVGYSPIAPGTCGTLLAIPVYIFFSAIPSPLYELTLVAFFFFSTWISENAERYFQKTDDPRIVIDEMMGFLRCCGFLGVSPPSLWVSFSSGFLIFSNHFLSVTWRDDSKEDLGSYWMM